MKKTNTAAQTRIYIVEDHPVMRIGLKMMLHESDCHVCGESSGVENLDSGISVAKPDITIFDLSINGETVFSTIEKVRRNFPQMGQIVYSMHDGPLFVETALKLGVDAYVTKADPVETIIDAIAAVRAGRRFLGPSLSISFEDRLSMNGGLTASLTDLSDREMEILTLIGNGFGRIDIARQLNLSRRTVDSYYERLKQKLGVSCNRELIRRAIDVAHTG